MIHVTHILNIENYKLLYLKLFKDYKLMKLLIAFFLLVIQILTPENEPSRGAPKCPSGSPPAGRYVHRIGKFIFPIPVAPVSDERSGWG